MTSRRGFFGSIAGLVLLRKAEKYKHWWVSDDGGTVIFYNNPDYMVNKDNRCFQRINNRWNEVEIIL